MKRSTKNNDTPMMTSVELRREIGKLQKMLKQAERNDTSELRSELSKKFNGKFAVNCNENNIIYFIGKITDVYLSDDGYVANAEYAYIYIYNSPWGRDVKWYHGVPSDNLHLNDFKVVPTQYVINAINKLRKDTNKKFDTAITQVKKLACE